MALPSGFPTRGPLAACLNALRLYRTFVGSWETPPAIGTAFGTEANQPTSSESSLHNSAEGHYVIRAPSLTVNVWTPTGSARPRRRSETWPHFVSAGSFAASCSSARAPERMPDIP